MDDLSLRLRYCLKCGEKDLTYTDHYTGTRYHVIESHHYDHFLEIEDVEPEQCFGPFATCPPPLTDAAYWDWLFSQPEPDEPDPIEVFIADLVWVE